MIHVDEIANVGRTLHVSEQARPLLIYDIHLGDDPEGNYAELLSAIRAIVGADREQEWPDDLQWRAAFSERQNAYFQDLTREQCEELMKDVGREKWHTLPWDFGSWLDALKARGWIWLGESRKGNFLTVGLQIIEQVANLEALEECIKASGCRVVRSEWLR